MASYVGTCWPATSWPRRRIDAPLLWHTYRFIFLLLIPHATQAETRCNLLAVTARARWFRGWPSSPPEFFVAAACVLFEQRNASASSKRPTASFASDDSHGELPLASNALRAPAYKMLCRRWSSSTRAACGKQAGACFLGTRLELGLSARSAARPACISGVIVC